MLAFSVVCACAVTRLDHMIGIPDLGTIALCYHTSWQRHGSEIKYDSACSVLSSGTGLVGQGSACRLLCCQPICSQQEVCDLQVEYRQVQSTAWLPPRSSIQHPQRLRHLDSGLPLLLGPGLDCSQAARVMVLCLCLLRQSHVLGADVAKAMRIIWLKTAGPQ